MAPKVDADALQNMKYMDLRKLAKELGVKANMKADKLQRAIRECLESQNRMPEQNNINQDEPDTKDETVEPYAKESTVLEVEERKEKRGRARKKPKTGKANVQQQAAVPSPIPPKQASCQNTPMQKVKTPQNKTTNSPRAQVSSLKKPYTPAKPSPLVAAVQGSHSKKVVTSGGRTLHQNLLGKRKSLTKTVVVSKNSPVVARRKSPRTSSGKKLGSGKNTVKQLTPSSQQKDKPATVSAQGAKRKRSRTPVGEKKTPGSDSKPAEKEGSSSRPNKRRRRSTYDLDPNEASPALKKMMATNTKDMSDQQVKEAILEAVNKSAKQKQQEGSKDKEVNTSTHIPRFAAFIAKKKAESARKVNTPDFKRIHESNFKRMESIDVYLAKKRKLNESVSASVKKARLLAQQTLSAVESLKKKHGSPFPRNVVHGAKVVKPVQSRTSLFQSPKPNTIPFKPTIVSTSKINTNFAAGKTPSFTAAKTTEKTSKTVSEMSTSYTAANRTFTNTPHDSKENKEKRKSMVALSEKRKSGISKDRRKSAFTPFKGAGLNTTQSTGKKAFDLKASLAKPLTWVPHTGKLPQWNLKATSNHQVDVKQVRTQTRDDRRQAAKLNRGDKKFANQMKRRGIKV